VSRATVKSEHDEVTRILGIWKEVFGMTLDRERVTRHLGEIKTWEATRCGRGDTKKSKQGRNLKDGRWGLFDGDERYP
jgi:hypothetical protein